MIEHETLLAWDPKQERWTYRERDLDSRGRRKRGRCVSGVLRDLGRGATDGEIIREYYNLRSWRSGLRLIIEHGRGPEAVDLGDIDPESLAPNVAEAAYQLERIGDFFLTAEARTWLEKRRAFMRARDGGTDG
jgi:hypothetical protein